MYTTELFRESSEIPLLVICLFLLSLIANFVLNFSVINITIFYILILLVFIFLYRRKILNQTYKSTAIYAPCSGTITKILNENGKYIIHIGLTLLDEHHQYMPISGNIIDIKKTGSKHYNIFDRRSVDNEHEIIKIKSSLGEIDLTRRSGKYFSTITTKVRDEYYKVGTYIGMIKMGSHCILSIPNNLKLNVITGDYLHAGKTLIAVKNIFQKQD